MVGAGLPSTTSRLHDEDGRNDGSNDDEQENAEGDEASLRPLPLGTAHGLGEPLSLRLSLGALTLL